jgi:formate hydrogenlyase subunit 3/multisubunit Na+/H+ antiporter MnhD subunit
LFPVLAIILPLLGAGGTLGLSLVPRARAHARYVALTAAGLTTLLILRFTWTEPVTVVLSLWQPSLLFGAALTLQTDAIMQPLALVLALITCSAILVELGSTEEPRPRLAATLLALLSAGLVALWTANLLTMIISWALWDLLYAAGHIAAGGSGRTAIRGLILGCVATLVLWSGALLAGGGAGCDSWSLMALSGAPLTLWMVAGVLRLGMYPFHLSTCDGLHAVPSLAAPLLLGPVVGWGLVLRLVQANTGLFPGNPWAPIVAAVTLAMGGFLAWSCASPRRALTWIGMGINGAVLLAAGWAGENSTAVIVAGSVIWALGIAVLFMDDGLRREAPWWSIPALIGALALGSILVRIELSATWGDASLPVSAGTQRLWWGAFFVGNLFLIPSLMRRLLPVPNQPTNRWSLVARGVGLGLSALLLIVVVLRPSLLVHDVPASSLGSPFAMPGLAGWLLWAVSLAGGGILAWQERNLRPKVGLFLGAAHDLLCLEWLYGAGAGALDRGLSILRAADEVVGGAGALLWSWLLFLLILLAVSVSSPIGSSLLQSLRH